MNKDDVVETVFGALYALGHSPGGVTPTTQLYEELGIDSIDAVELAATVCKTLGVPPQAAPDIRGVRTVAELAERIQPLVGDSRPGLPSSGAV
ncbi:MULTISPECIES: acyl carrier protein [unclassified Corallococcus]|uniref:acyl carrier protein n=1 Tax=unclassified Corallococcus TaxID=2685029 RepID=UPI001A8E5482|nr:MULTISPECIES: phosphopantetheine-binding protein [unclassified Corallococcus]MBN9684647.1 hypothetical protein [Corallococcus sp. NCSPR001]WAS83882.1 phosphopantetheine-binding protein [Corallococcus sp. NCRR]